MSVTISGTCPVARGSYVGGSTPRAVSAAAVSSSLRYDTAYQASPDSADLARILSSMSVTLRMSETSRPWPRVIHRRRTSNATAKRTCPRCGGACVVSPQM